MGFQDEGGGLGGNDRGANVSGGLVLWVRGRKAQSRAGTEEPNEGLWGRKNGEASSGNFVATAGGGVGVRR